MKTTAAPAADPGIKLADTPADDAPTGQGGDQTAGNGQSETSTPAAAAEGDQAEEPSANGKSKHRRPKGVKKLSAEQMDAEIDRVNLSNGKPVLARDTVQDDSKAAADNPSVNGSPASPSDAPPAVNGAPKGKKAAAKKKGKPAEVEETKEEHHARRVQNAQKDLCDISMAHSDSADLTKSLKKRRDVATQYLADLLHDGPEDLPLIDAADEARKKAESNGAAGSGNSGNGKGQKELPLDSSDNAPVWRSISIGELGEFGMSVRTHKALMEINKIKTMGDLADFSNANRGMLKQLKGIGKVAVEQLQDALAAFWKKNPQLVPDEPVKKGAETEAGKVTAASAPAGKKKAKAAATKKPAETAAGTKSKKATKAAVKKSAPKKKAKATKAARPRSR